MENLDEGDICVLEGVEWDRAELGEISSCYSEQFKSLELFLEFFIP